MRTLKSANRFAEGRGISLFLAAFGVCFVVAGLFSGGLFHNGLKALNSFGFPLQIFLAFGMMLLCGGIGQAHFSARFGKAVAMISVEEVIPGEEFEFSYRLPVRRETEIETIGIFLVLRERVEYYHIDETETADIDRLFQQHIREGRQYGRHDTVEVHDVLRVPEGERGLRNSLMNRKDAKAEQIWVVKVRIHPRKGDDVCGEFGLEVPASAQERHVPAPGRFDVFLNDLSLGKRLRVTPVLQSLLPHLGTGQIADLFRHGSGLLLEEVSGEEAQQAKELLAAVGAEVTVCAVDSGVKGGEQT